MHNGNGSNVSGDDNIVCHFDCWPPTDLEDVDSISFCAQILDKQDGLQAKKTEKQVNVGKNGKKANIRVSKNLHQIYHFISLFDRAAAKETILRCNAILYHVKYSNSLRRLAYLPNFMPQKAHVLAPDLMRVLNLDKAPPVDFFNFTLFYQYESLLESIRTEFLRIDFHLSLEQPITIFITVGKIGKPFKMKINWQADTQVSPELKQIFKEIERQINGEFEAAIQKFRT